MPKAASPHTALTLPSLDPLSQEDRHHGFAVLVLFDNWQRWIKRRTERVEFVGDGAVRRSTAVDFTLRAELLEAARVKWGERGMHYVPIALLAKHPLTAFRLRDEEERVIPLLTRTKNAAIATGMLAALAQSIVARALSESGPGGGRAGGAPSGLRADQIRLPESLEVRLRAMAHLPYRDLGVLSPMWSRSTDGVAEARDVYDSFAALLDLTGEGKADPPGSWAWEKTPDEDGGPPTWQASADLASWAAILVTDAGFRALAHALARNFLLCVPVAHEREARRVFEYSYQEPIIEPALTLLERTRQRDGAIARGFEWIREREERLEGLSDSDPSRRSRSSDDADREKIHPWTKLLRGIGWRPKRFAFEVPAVGWGGSFHFEVTAPEGIQIRRATLSVVPARNGEKSSRPTYGARNNDRLQLYATGVARGSQGKAEVSLKPRSATVVRGAALAAVMTTVALLVTLIYLPEIRNQDTGALDVTGALLLVMPGLLAVYVARGGEHPMTTSMLYGLRILAGASGMWAVIGAGLMLIGPADGLRLVLWIAIILAALTTALVLTVAWRLSAKGRTLEHLLPEPLGSVHVSGSRAL